MSEEHISFRNVPLPEQPRKRLRTQGAEALSDVDLLAIILRVGTARENVLEQAKTILTKYGGLPGLTEVPFTTLCQEFGVGEAKAAQIQAALELGRRAWRER